MFRKSLAVGIAILVVQLQFISSSATTYEEVPTSVQSQSSSGGKASENQEQAEFAFLGRYTTRKFDKALPIIERLRESVLDSARCLKNLEWSIKKRDRTINCDLNGSHSDEGKDLSASNRAADCTVSVDDNTHVGHDHLKTENAAEGSVNEPQNSDLSEGQLTARPTSAGNPSIEPANFEINKEIGVRLIEFLEIYGTLESLWIELSQLLGFIDVANLDESRDDKASESVREVAPEMNETGADSSSSNVTVREA